MHVVTVSMPVQKLLSVRLIHFEKPMAPASMIFDADLKGATPDGFCVVDVWESRGHFDRFMQEHLGEQLVRAGVPQPQITEFEVHASERRD